MITYRKNKSGDWVAFGPVTEVKPGYVIITKKLGMSEQRRIVSVGKSFLINGVPHCYGYFEEKTEKKGNRQSRSNGQSRRSRDWPGKDCPCCGSEPLNQDLYCWECGYRGSR